jgi:RNA polymerase sigma-70 factor, ECF subfamily
MSGQEPVLRRAFEPHSTTCQESSAVLVREGGVMTAALQISRAESATADRPTLEECYATHRAFVFHRCLRYGAGDVAFAEEVTHDVFVKLLEHLPHLHDTHDLGGWLNRVTANVAISRLRRERSLLGKLRALWVTTDRADTDTARHVIERKQVAGSVLEALRMLTPRERVIVCMKVLDGASQREIARALDVSEGYVSKLLQRSMQRLATAGWEVDDVER